MTVSQEDLLKARRALLEKRLQKARAKETEPQAIGRRPKDEPLTLSFAQRRLWFLDQLEPDSPVYNIPLALHLVGWLDVPALRRAIEEIVRRHQVLQMIYATVAEEPLLIPHPDLRPDLNIVDLGVLPSSEREAVMRRLATEETQRPFNLAHDFPLRVTLLRLDETEHALLLTMHHIASDAWSMGLLIDELAALYEAFCKNAPSPLPDLPIQYDDFAHWQRSWLQDDVLEGQLGYWKRQFAGAPAVLDLLTDRPRPPIRTSNGALHRFRLPPTLAQAVKKLSQETGGTPFMTLLAAFQALLQRYTGQHDIVVGTPIAGRNRSEIESLIGFFINTLVLRTDLSGNPSVRELLRRVREVTLEAYAHQDLPFEKLVEELNPERALSHTPLFQVMFNYRNVPRSTLELPGLTVKYLRANSDTEKFDLSMALGESGEEITGTLSYNTDLFDEDTIRRMVDHFEALLTGMVSDLDQRLVELPMITSAERQKLLGEWTDTQAAYPEVQCLHQLFEEQVARTPNTVAVIFEEQRYTYRQLNQRANQVAHHLQSLGVGPDVRVGLFMERSLDILVALLGILKAGGAYVPLDPIYPQQRVRFMLNDVQVSILVTQSDLAADLPDLGDVHVLCLDRDWEAIAQHSTANPLLCVIPTNLIYVLFTSGSTGRPKGVAVEHGNYLNYFQGIMPRLKISPGMSFAMVSTFSTDLGTIQFWAPLTTGGTVHIIAYERATDPEAMSDYFSRHTIDVLKLVPSHFDALQGVPGAEAIVPRHLVIFTGEASHWDTVAQVKALNPDCMVQDHYGVTETTCATLTYIAPDQSPVQHAATLPLGQPLGNVRVYTLDALMEPTPIGVPGELYIGGFGVTRGYIGRSTLTAERFVPDPFSRLPGARLYRTGDLACYRAGGSLRLLGRADHQVKIRGYRVETGEIEALLCEHPAVQDAVVLAREDTPGDRRLVAYVQPHLSQDGELALGSLRDGLREQLPDYMVPSAFVTLDHIPLNPNGKVDRFALPVPEYTRLDSGAGFVAPRNELEQHIAARWSDVLGVEEIGIDDNFFDLGGESFKAIRVARRIAEGVSVMDVFKYPTVRQLATRLAGGELDQGGLLYELTRPVPVDQKTLSLVCVPYGGGNAVMFQPLADALPSHCSLYAVQMPGHDFARHTETLEPLPGVAQQCAEEIKRDLNGPIALYGHCVGGALALEIARLLEKDGVPVAGVFLGATFPTPRLPGRFFELLNRLFPSDRWTSSRRVYEVLRALGGFTDEMDPEEQAFVLNGLRHDVREAEEYYTQAYAQLEKVKLEAPIVSIIGAGDRATEFYEERFREWESFSDTVDLAVIPQAGHYFLKHQAGELAQVVADQSAVWRGEAPSVRRVEPAVALPKPAVAPNLNVFFLVALGQFVSLIGTGLTNFALGVWALQKTGAVSDFAFISVFGLVPTILLLPIAGAVVDRRDRRLIMIVSDIVAVCSTLFIAFMLWQDALQIWHVYVVVTIGSIGNAFQVPAYTASITQLVPKQYLGHANGLVQMGDAFSGLFAPLLGGALVVIIGLSGVVLIDVVTFVFAVTSLLLVRFPDTLFRQRQEPLRQEVVEGWRYIVKRKGLTAMVVFFTVFNFALGLMRVLVTPLILSFGSPVVLGRVVAASGAGRLIGGLVMGAWGGTKRRAEGMIGFTTLFGLSIVVTGLRPSATLITVGIFCFGFSLTLINAHWLVLIQTKVGLELQGRVLATNRMLALSMMPLGFVLAGPLADKVFEPLLADGGALVNSVGRLLSTGPGRGMGLMVVLAGAFLTVWGVLGYRHRPLRFMEDEMPDAIPDAVVVTDRDELQKQADRQLAAKAT